MMWEQALFVAFISAGLVIAVQGLLIRRNPEKARPFFIERRLFDVLDPKSSTERARILGRLRVIYGLFFISVGSWGLLG